MRGTSLTTSNTAIAAQPPCALRVPAARGQERGALYFYHGLLEVSPERLGAWRAAARALQASDDKYS
jgi:hypothetical protein